MGVLLSPDTFLMKICMFGSGSAEEAREEMEEMEEMLLERMMAVVVWLMAVMIGDTGVLSRDAVVVL
jgi:hypothetical protein